MRTYFTSLGRFGLWAALASTAIAHEAYGLSLITFPSFDQPDLRSNRNACWLMTITNADTTDAVTVAFEFTDLALARAKPRLPANLLSNCLSPHDGTADVLDRDRSPDELSVATGGLTEVLVGPDLYAGTLEILGGRSRTRDGSRFRTEARNDAGTTVEAAFRQCALGERPRPIAALHDAIGANLATHPMGMRNSSAHARVLPWLAEHGSATNSVVEGESPSVISFDFFASFLHCCPVRTLTTNQMVSLGSEQQDDEGLGSSSRGVRKHTDEALLAPAASLLPLQRNVARKGALAT